MELNEISEFRNLDLKDIRALNLKPPHELLEVLKNYEVQKGLAHIFDGYEPGICLSEPVSRRLSLVDEESLVSGISCSEASAVPMQNEYTQPNDESSETPMQLSNFFNDATGATSNMDEKTYADVLDMEQFYQDLERSPRRKQKFDDILEFIITEKNNEIEQRFAEHLIKFSENSLEILLKLYSRLYGCAPDNDESSLILPEKNDKKEEDSKHLSETKKNKGMKKQLQILKKKIEIVGREIMKRKGPTHPSNFSRKRKSSSGSIQKKRNRIQSFSPDLEIEQDTVDTESTSCLSSTIENQNGLAPAFETLNLNISVFEQRSSSLNFVKKQLIDNQVVTLEKAAVLIQVNQTNHEVALTKDVPIILSSNKLKKSKGRTLSKNPKPNAIATRKYRAKGKEKWAENEIIIKDLEFLMKIIEKETMPNKKVLICVTSEGSDKSTPYQCVQVTNDALYNHLLEMIEDEGSNPSLESPEHTKKVLIVSPQDLIDLNKNPETLVIAYSIAPETVQNSSIMPNESLSFNQTTKHFFSGQQAKIVAGPVAFAPSKKSKEKKGQPRSANPNPNNIACRKSREKSKKKIVEKETKIDNLKDTVTKMILEVQFETDTPMLFERMIERSEMFAKKHTSERTGQLCIISHQKYIEMIKNRQFVVVACTPE